MITIYYNDQKAIVASERTRTYKTMTVQEAAVFSNDVKVSLKPRINLVLVRRNIMTGNKISDEMLGECRFCESPVLESDRWDVWDDGSVSHSECGGN